MKTALDLSAVYETVYVECVDRFSARTSAACAPANWEKGEEDEEKTVNRELGLTVVKSAFTLMLYPQICFVVHL